MINNELKKLSNLLFDSNRDIVITSHKNPDGDAIGSSLALYEYLKLLGFSVHCIIPNSFPTFLSWLKGSEKILIYQNEVEKSQKLLVSSDIIFCMDYNAFHRLGEMESDIRNSNAKKILIDHHPDPEENFDVSISKIKISSTAEIVYKIIDFFKNKNKINKSIAEALYVGIITDTGSLSYTCNYPNTYKTIAFLLKKDIDAEKIQQNLYSTFSLSRLRLLGHCLSNRLQVLPKFKTAYIYLTKDDLKKFNYQHGDTEGVVNYALTIQDVYLAALFIERKKHIRISLRSKGKIAVNDFAKTYYKGGGHINAAGGDSFKNMKDTIKDFKEFIKNYFNKLNI